MRRRRRRRRSGRPRPSSCGTAPRPGSAPPGLAARPPARSRPQRAATSHGTRPEPDAPNAAGSWGAAVGERFRLEAMGDPGGWRTSARAGPGRRGGSGGSGGPAGTQHSPAAQGGDGGPAVTASSWVAALAGLPAASSLGRQSQPRPHGGALCCQTAPSRDGVWVGGWLRRSCSESARPGSSMSKGKGKCLPQGGA